MRRSTGRIPSLDGLRALSVAFVIWEHLNLSGALPFDQKWIGFGNLGVRIFFVISGFIITALLLDELEATGSISLQDFYIRRVFRIIPIWACFVGVILVALALTHRFPGGRELIAVLTFNVDYVKMATVDLQHLWSLSVEEKFYFLWPSVLFFCGANRASRIAWIVVLVVPLLRMYEAHFGATFEAPAYWTFHQNADALAVGCILALSRSWLANHEGVKNLVSRPWMSGFMLLITLGLATTQHLGNTWWTGPGISALNLTIGALIWTVVNDTRSALARIFNASLMRTLGLWSFGIYLWQQPLTFHRKVGMLAVFPVNVLVVLVVACAGYYLIERTLQSLGRSVAILRRMDYVLLDGSRRWTT